VTLTVVADDDAAPWLFYGSTVDKSTSVSTTVIGVP
jgi:hypothetical protein